MNTPYDLAAEIYRMSGLAPIPVSGKIPPVSGCTGKTGTVTDQKIAAWLDPKRCTRWCGDKTHRHAGYDNVALRHEGTISIDIDEGYGAKSDGTPKQGVRNLTEWARRLGLSPLPPTVSSTARGDDSPSRQYFYRLPREAPSLDTKPCEDVEVPAYHHRYSVVFPSVHPDTGALYRWYEAGETGLVLPTWGPATNRFPRRGEFALLPDDWFKALWREVAAIDPNATVVGLEELLDSFPSGPPSPRMAQLIEHWSTAHVGHGEIGKAGKHALLCGREGEPGARTLWEVIHARYTEYVQDARPHEAERQLFGEDGIVAVTVAAAQRHKISGLPQILNDPNAAWRKLGVDPESGRLTSSRPGPADSTAAQHPELASVEDLQAFVATFTRAGTPRYATNRSQWLTSALVLNSNDRPRQFHRHAVAAMQDVFAGRYSAQAAVDLLTEVYTDPRVAAGLVLPLDLALRAALHAALNTMERRAS
jgi:hypothetical protein